MDTFNTSISNTSVRSSRMVEDAFRAAEAVLAAKRTLQVAAENTRKARSYLAPETAKIWALLLASQPTNGSECASYFMESLRVAVSYQSTVLGRVSSPPVREFWNEIIEVCIGPSVPFFHLSGHD